MKVPRPPRRMCALLLGGLVVACGRPTGPASPVNGTSTPAKTAVRVLASNGVREAVEAVQPQIEAEIGRPLAAEFSTAIGLKRRIDAGEPFDVIVLTPAIVDDLEKKGVVAMGTRVDIASTGVGVGVPAGAPKSDVSTPEALKRTILAAKTVAYTAEGQSRATVDKALATLGIADVVAKKAMVTGPGEGPSAVAAGKADLVMTLISEILAPGVQLLGPFPDELQTSVVFTAARSAKTTDPAADALVGALAGPLVARSLTEHALEALAR